MGSILLTLAAVLATAALVAGRVRAEAERPLQLASLGTLSATVAFVLWLLVSEDTSYEIVVESTRPGLRFIRRAMGLWGTSSGSLLFFSLVMGVVLLAAPVTDRMRAAPSIVLAALTWTSVLAESPFEQLDAPAIAGSGLSPILEHWAMIIHPPLLYIGLALSLVPAIVDPKVAARWAAPAIAVLTIALALGGGWAYEELGWGGWYAWDPVENVALIPWLLLVAGVHVGQRHLASRYLALLTWPTVFAGAAMTRTSLRTSVHAFANNEDLGLILWPLATIVTFGAIAQAIAIRKDHRTAIRASRRWPIALVSFAALVVALGTFRPFIPGDGTEGTFYTRSLYPVVIVGLIALGLSPRWSDGLKRTLVTLYAIGAVVGAGAAVLVSWTTWWQVGLAAALGGAILATVGPGIRPLPRTLAHVGMICVLAGALGGTASTTRNILLDAGESREVAGHTIVNQGVSFAEGPPPVITVDVLIDGDPFEPSIAVFTERALRLPEVATRRGLFTDVQVVARSADDDGGAQLTVNVEPLTQFVWIGTGLITSAFALGTVRKRQPVTPSRKPVEAST